MGVIHDTYNRLTYAMVTVVVTGYWRQLSNQVASWPAVTIIVFGIIASMFLDSKVRKIPDGKLEAVRNWLTYLVILFITTMAYLLALALYGIFEEDTGNLPTLASVYKLIVLMMILSLLLALADIFSKFRAAATEKAPLLST